MQTNVFRVQFTSEYFHLIKTLAFIHTLVFANFWRMNILTKELLLTNEKCVKQGRGTGIVLFALGRNRLELRLDKSMTAVQFLTQYVAIFKSN